MKYEAVYSLVMEMHNRLKMTAKPAFCATRVSIFHRGEGSLALESGEIHSLALSRTLRGASEAYIMAVTLGAGVDRELLALSKRSMTEHFVYDAVASAYVEAACDAAEAQLCGGLLTTHRFSPGYGDLPLDLQRYILDRLSAERLLGVTLTDTSLMIPTKSITAIIGIKS